MKKTLIFAAAAMAMASAFAGYSFAYLETVGAKGEATAEESAYTAYFCTVEAAQTYFGATAEAGITAYLTENYSAGMDALAAGGTAMSLDEFNEGMYSFYSPFVSGKLTDGDYIAVVSYADNMFRVFESSASGGRLAFDLDPIVTGGGTAGAWTSVPEPTSGLLLLLGVAGLALKRKRA